MQLPEHALFYPWISGPWRKGMTRESSSDPPNHGHQQTPSYLPWRPVALVNNSDENDWFLTLGTKMR